MSELAMHEVVRRAPQAAAAVAGRTVTLVLEGEIDRQDMREIAAQLERLSRHSVNQMVIDFAGVPHFDFRAVPALLRQAEAFREQGGDIRLAALSPYLHAIFRSAGANDGFDYFGDAEDARQSFSSRAFLRAGVSP